MLNLTNILIIAPFLSIFTDIVSFRDSNCLILYLKYFQVIKKNYSKVLELIFFQ